MDGELSIQEVSAATGLTPHTLRYYEKAGLLERVERNGGGHRRYAQRDVDFLLFLSRLRKMGMPIHQVKRYAELSREGPSTIGQRGELLQAYRRQVCDHIAALEKNLQILDYKIRLYGQGWAPCDAADPCLEELRRLCTEQAARA